MGWRGKLPHTLSCSRRLSSVVCVPPAPRRGGAGSDSEEEGGALQPEKAKRRLKRMMRETGLEDSEEEGSEGGWRWLLSCCFGQLDCWGCCSCVRLLGSWARCTARQACAATHHGAACLDLREQMWRRRRARASWMRRIWIGWRGRAVGPGRQHASLRPRRSSECVPLCVGVCWDGLDWWHLHSVCDHIMQLVSMR